MRRAVIFAGTVLAVLAVSSPSYAFAHNAVTNPVWHAVLDVLTLAAVSAPLWTAYAWGGRRRGALLALIAFVQLPVAAIAFTPIADPVLHTVLLGVALAITVASLVSVRRLARPVAETPVSADH
ncbi:MAG: hypothetical protein HOV79_09080 [Hamadaea sp.]|nr:hypothetical protein [Hamadaea sp.]